MKSRAAALTLALALTLAASAGCTNVTVDNGGTNPPADTAIVPNDTGNPLADALQAETPDSFAGDSSSDAGADTFDAPSVDSSDASDAAPDVALDAAADAASTDPSGTFFLSCLPTLAGGDPSKSLLFYASVTYDAPTKKLALHLFPLNGVGDTAATKLDKSQTTGGPFDFVDILVDAAGKWSTSPLASIDLAGVANRISGNPITIQGLRLDGGQILGADRLCANLHGTLIRPFTQDLGDPNYCVFKRMKDGDALPVVTENGKTFVGLFSTDYHCP